MQPLELITTELSVRLDSSGLLAVGLKGPRGNRLSVPILRGDRHHTIFHPRAAAPACSSPQPSQATARPSPKPSRLPCRAIVQRTLTAAHRPDSARQLLSLRQFWEALSRNPLPCPALQFHSSSLRPPSRPHVSALQQRHCAHNLVLPVRRAHRMEPAKSLYPLYCTSRRHRGRYSQGRHGDMVQNVRPLPQPPQPLDASSIGIEGTFGPVPEAN